MTLTFDGGPELPASGKGIRAAFVSGEEFVILSRGDEFLQSGHWYFVERSTDDVAWWPAFEAITVCRPNPGEDSTEPDLYAVEFPDAASQYAVHQVLTRDELLARFLAYLDGGDGWRSGLTWETLSSGQ